MSLSIDERISFIESLDIYNDPAIAAEATAASGSAAVNGSAAVYYAANVSAQMKNDVINSTLFAQLTADAKYPGRPMNKMQEWYNCYKQVLERIGWVVMRFLMSEVDNANSYGSVDKLVLKLAAAQLTEGELALLTKTITALKHPKNSDAVRIFDSKAGYTNDASFQVGVASNSGGHTLFHISTHQYHSSDRITSVLFSTFGPSKVSFFTSNQTMLLNGDVYTQVRQAVLKRLGENAIKLVKSIDI
ncbi:hypothetical protein C8Q70DRAFT_362987 [Cubamyces menziesii]|nr:hypothetical protein C8Q70DRAFT_362987 [Cubamyces menziesii]